MGVSSALVTLMGLTLLAAQPPVLVQSWPCQAVRSSRVPKWGEPWGCVHPPGGWEPLAYLHVLAWGAFAMVHTCAQLGAVGPLPAP